MDFYVATGPADACGPGCSEWIAVDGKFDQDAGKRFRAFLEFTAPARPAGIFSLAGRGACRRDRNRARPAGTQYDGRCRTNRHTKVARSSAFRAATATHGSNQARMCPRSSPFKGAQCHSACVFALIGAATRRIAPPVLVGIHSPRATSDRVETISEQNPETRRLTSEERNQGLWRFVMTLGVDPELVDAGRTGSRTILSISSAARKSSVTGLRVARPVRDALDERGNPTVQSHLVKAIHLRRRSSTAHRAARVFGPIRDTA